MDEPDTNLTRTGQDRTSARGLSARAAAEVLGVDERTIRRAIARGELRATKRGNVYVIWPDDLTAYRLPWRAAEASGTLTLPLPPLLVPFTERRSRELGVLPRPRTAFVGREQELADLGELLRQLDVPLITLLGPGGVGKTRLALAAAADAGLDFPDGVWFVGLAPLTDPTSVPAAIAAALGLRESGDAPLVDRIVAFLEERTALLLLDNFEHVVTAAGIVATLVSSCPSLTVLVTSRVVLKVSGEHLFPVPPLSLPGQARTITIEDVGDTDAVRLFCVRASAANPGFALTETNASAVAAICARLDGMPLAIELAAARSSVLAPSELLARLSPALPLLDSGPRDQPARLRGMRDAIAWSYDLLDDGAQVLFRWLSVFVGGFSLQAAEAIGRGNGARRDEDGLVALSPLVEGNLVRLVTGLGGGTRYAMLETIREFGLERLEAEGEIEDARRAHAALLLAFAERTHPNRIEPGERIDDRLGRIEDEHPNLRAALRQLQDAGDSQGVLRLTGALSVFWHLRGHLEEGRTWLEWGLANTPDSPTPERAWALLGLALILFSQGEHELAVPYADLGEAIARQVGDPMLSASAIHIPALIEMARRRWDLVGPLMTRALEGWRGVGARSEEAATLVTLSNCAQASGDLPLAAARAEEALAIYRTLGHTAGEFNALCRSARVAYERGDDMAAAAAYEAGLRLWTGLDERWSRAARFDDESRSMEGGPFPRWVCVDNAWSLMGALSGLARIAAAHGRSEQAATLVGAVDRLGTPLTSLSDEAAQAALAALGEARFTELRATGRALSLTAAVAMALSAVPHARRHDGAPTHGLTPREVEVLRLLVDGHSDREIAGLLFISRHTAANHVASILGKLALHSRAAAAAYAVRHGLD